MKLPAFEILKPRTPADWLAVRKLCSDSGNAGDPIEETRRPFFEEHWIGPYQKLSPQWTYLARETEDGNALGYLSGCPDTLGFERRRFFAHTLPLYAQVTLGRFLQNSDTRTFVRRTLRLDRSPERSFPASLHRLLDSQYPAHLHINVAAPARSLGVGARLIERYVTDLGAARIPGIHLYCGEKPVPFYLRNGFTELARIEFRPGKWVYCLGRKL